MCCQRLYATFVRDDNVRAYASVELVVRDSRARLRIAGPLNGNQSCRMRRRRGIPEHGLCTTRLMPDPISFSKSCSRRAESDCEWGAEGAGMRIAVPMPAPVSCSVLVSF